MFFELANLRAFGARPCLIAADGTTFSYAALADAAEQFARQLPLDRQLILDAARGKRLVVTFEESVVTGGFGSGVLELFEEAYVPAIRRGAAGRFSLFTLTDPLQCTP